MPAPVPPPLPSKQADERRVAPRFQPAYGTIFRLSEQLIVDPGMTIGLVWNISETGVSMLVGNPPKAGMKLPGELAPESGAKGLAVVLCIVHVRPIQTGDFFVGAQFERRLAADEIGLFVVPKGKRNSEPSTNGNANCAMV